jgi:hypothetical protein
LDHVLNAPLVLHQRARLLCHAGEQVAPRASADFNPLLPPPPPLLSGQASAKTKGRV